MKKRFIVIKDLLLNKLLRASGDIRGMSYLDSLKGRDLENSILKYVILILLAIVLMLITSNIYFHTKASQSLEHQRIILVPAINRNIVVNADSYISESYIRAVSNSVVSLNENWNYQGYMSNINQLCRENYMPKQCELVKQTIKNTDRESFVTKNKIFSVFTIDEENSEYHFCEKLKRPCSLVVGKRTLFFNGNDKVDERDVAYFIIGENLYPDETNPYAIRISRLKIKEGENPKQLLLPQLELAMKGDKAVLDD
jgi:hypothetical protein